MSRAQSTRIVVYGPYRRGDTYRLVEKIGRNCTATHSYSSRAAAERAKTELQVALDGKLPEALAGAIEDYEAHLRASGLSKDGITVTLAGIRGILGEDRALVSLTPATCRALYLKRTTALTRFGGPFKPATHRSELQRTKAFLDWCVESGYLRSNPAVDVKPIGKVSKGKPQHTRDQARRFLAKCLEIATDPDIFAAQHGIAAALSLVLGSRASECLKRRVQDVDSDGTVLIIPHGKTQNARRELEIPEFLRPHIRRLTDGRPGTSWLFASPFPARKSGGRPTHRSRQWLWSTVKEICRDAEIPEVPPHGLRGTFSTIGLQASTVPHLVAAALGHSSPSITMEHYADKPQIEAEQRRRAWKVLDGGKGG